MTDPKTKSSRPSQVNKMSATTKQTKNALNAVEVKASKETKSQTLAKLATTSVWSAITLKSYTEGANGIEVYDLISEMKKAGNEAVAGDLGRVERMLANQMLTLDAVFNNLAQRAHRQETFKGIEVLMRLALKAQAQSRSTAETLAVIKNPMPYIKQANIAHGHQQVNNNTVEPEHPLIAAPAEKTQSQPNKLLKDSYDNAVDTGATAATGRIDQAVETLGEIHRAKNG